MVNGISTDERRHWALACLGAVGISLMFLAAPSAAAEPVDPADPAAQAVSEGIPVPVMVAATPAVVAAAPEDGVPHLPSPDNLPPGTTQASPEGPNMSYLRYLWQAIHTPGVTMSDALILIAQRPLDTKAAGPRAEPLAPTTP